MPYDEENDAYICHAGHKIQAAYEKKTKSKLGYPIVTTVYSCVHCNGCSHKSKCIKGAMNTLLSDSSPISARIYTSCVNKSSTASVKRSLRKRAMVA